MVLHTKAIEEGHPPAVAFDAILRGMLVATFRFGREFDSHPEEKVGVLCADCANQEKAALAAASAFLAKE